MVIAKDTIVTGRAVRSFRLANDFTCSTVSIVIEICFFKYFSELLVVVIWVENSFLVSIEGKTRVIRIETIGFGYVVL